METFSLLAMPAIALAVAAALVWDTRRRALRNERHADRHPAE